MSLYEKTQELLETIPIHTSSSSSIGTFERWIGLIDDDDDDVTTTNNGPSMEDDESPPSNSFFESFNSLLIWSSCQVCLSPLQDENDFEKIEVIRVMKWLRHCMDQNVKNNDNKSFLELLLVVTKNSDSLIAAMYHHVGQLSQLQSIQNTYIRNIRKSRARLVEPSGCTSTTTFQSTVDRLQKDFDQHLVRVEYILGELYSLGTLRIRSFCRQHLANYWSTFARSSSSSSSFLSENNTSASGMNMTLRLLLRILKGSSSLKKHLLTTSLLPLHTPSSLVLWRDQTAVLDLYHEPLVQCTAILLRKETTWISPTLEALLNTPIWTQSNTPKLILLLHEIDILYTLFDEDHIVVVPDVWPSLLSKLVSCISSENSRLSERSLQFFKNETFKRCFWLDIEKSLPVLLKAVIKTELPWNPTVRKMTYHVLKDLYDTDPNAFAKACCSGQNNNNNNNKTKTVATKNESTDNTHDKIQATATATATATQKMVSKAPDFSLKTAMGSWRPPKRNNAMPPPARRVRKTRPTPMKGVAPWSRSQGAPPLTVTGVAPWSLGNYNKGNEALKPKKPKEGGLQVLTEEQINSSSPAAEGNNTALARVLKCMEALKPPNEEEEGSSSSWSKVQMAETPTLLPSLKFHDLVFGHELGSGAFGLVKYARRIDRSTTRSRWSEYAVKIISTEKIQEMGYESSVQREIATLKILSHPGIARLISSFRFRDGAYLVLEYASKGDLHTVLQNKGSLDYESTQFVIGEIVATLSCIHDLGFVYSDLKPENILITETGHIKLTDFGACRPHTKSAKEMIQKSAKDLLKKLRNGDYRLPKKYKEQQIILEEKADDNQITVSDWSGKSSEEQQISLEEEITEEEEDLRVEGTIAYLPPEVVLGGIPTAAADLWALGCVLYQCLSGRPPLLDTDEETTKKKIVKFDLSIQQQQQQRPLLFNEDHDKDIQEDAKELIQKLMNPNMEQRISICHVANASFFDGKNVFGLYREEAYPLDVGTVGPVKDARWSRRQLSSIWAPQPKAYDVSSLESKNIEQSFADVKTTPILEKEGEIMAFIPCNNNNSIVEQK